MKFSEALEKCQATGIGIYRPSWNGNANRKEGVAQFVTVQRPDEHSKMTTPYLYIQQPNGITPWVPSQGDLFAEDWATL